MFNATQGLRAFRTFLALHECCLKNQNSNNSNISKEQRVSCENLGLTRTTVIFDNYMKL